MMGLAALSSWLSARPSPGSRREGARVFAVVGSGFSGTLTAIGLLRHSTPGDRVLLFERRPAFGRGLAYSPVDESHLLNVRARNMSAFPERPEHFLRWLEATRPADEMQRSGASLADSFVPRHVYGAYLQSLLRRAIAAHGGTALALVHDEVIGLAEDESGVRLEVAGGTVYRADAAVLAIGNFAPAQSHGAYRGDPWSDEAVEGLDPAAEVFILGSGLTMVDVVLSLLRRGHRGPIHAWSRRGLAPHSHRAHIEPLPIDMSEVTASGLTISALLRAVRHLADRLEAGGGDWRSVVDGLRPYLPALWHGLSQPERARFLRHARPWWDVHRHRLAPSAAARIESARLSGQLRIVAGRVIQMEVGPKTVALALRRRGSDTVERLQPARVIDCTGLKVEAAAQADALIRHLCGAGLARIDPLGLGLDVDPATDALIDRGGRPSDRLFAIGPWTRPAHWEIVAIPDIRTQCARLSSALVREVRQTGDAARSGRRAAS